MSIPEILSFVLASTVLAFTPGPDIIFVIVTSLGQGFKTAFKFILGLSTGIILHTTLIVVGVSTLISQSTYGLTVLKVFSVSYLIWLAYLTFIHRKEQIHLKSEKLQSNYYVRGFIMNVTNPKVLLFFLAFFPQFANLQVPGYQSRLIVLGLIFIAVTIAVFSFIAWLSANSSRKYIENPKFSVAINYLAIVVFIGVAVLLIFN